jgi:NAD(P)-dependent dehydrogenase (short-subunit alcohol dehydrogenase family)
VVNVSSGVQGRGHIDFDDLQGERHYGGLRAYSQSKLANVVFTYELARRLDGTGVTANCMHPGSVRTGFGRNNGGLLGFGVRLAGPFMRSPEQGADTVVWLASSPAVEGMTGRYFADRKERRTRDESYDRAVQARLWEVSERLTGLA